MRRKCGTSPLEWSLLCRSAGLLRTCCWRDTLGLGEGLGPEHQPASTSIFPLVLLQSCHPLSTCLQQVATISALIRLPLSIWPNTHTHTHTHTQTHKFICIYMCVYIYLYIYDNIVDINIYIGNQWNFSVLIDIKMCNSLDVNIYQPALMIIGFILLDVITIEFWVVKLIYVSVGLLTAKSVQHPLSC